MGSTGVDASIPETVLLIKCGEIALARRFVRLRRACVGRVGASGVWACGVVPLAGFVVCPCCPALAWFRALWLCLAACVCTCDPWFFGAPTRELAFQCLHGLRPRTSVTGTPHDGCRPLRLATFPFVRWLLCKSTQECSRNRLLGGECAKAGFVCSACTSTPVNDVLLVMESVAWSPLGQGVSLPCSPDFFIMGLSFLMGLSCYWVYLVGRSALVSTCCGATLRVRVFLKYILMDALSYPSAPGPSGDRGGTPRWGLMAGYAYCTQYIRCCPMVPVQVRFMEPPATIVGEWCLHHSL